MYEVLQDAEVQEDPITKAEREFYKIIKEVSLKFKAFAESLQESNH
jgi:hypothetical protein